VFDARVEDLIACWSSSPCNSPRQRLIVGLPKAMGGFGLARMEMIAPAAYHASLTSALKGARRVLGQSALCAMLYRETFDHAVANDAVLARHFAAHALDGSDAGLSCTASRVQPDVHGATLRTYLLTDSRMVPSTAAKLPCRGCTRTFETGGAWGQHVSNCVSAPGGHATTAPARPCARFLPKRISSRKRQNRAI
jgi:hypothetical protein